MAMHLRRQSSFGNEKLKRPSRASVVAGKLPTAETRWLSIELRNQLHSNTVPNRIWTSEERVYGHSPAGKTEGRYLVGRTSSLQQGFCGNGQAGLPVAVDDKAAFASEQRIVGSIMSFPHSTAVGTPLRGVPAINRVQRDTFVKASLLKVPTKSVEGNPHYLPVEPPSFGTEPSEVLDADVGVVLKSEISDVSDYFPDPVLDEVVLLGLGRFKSPLGTPAPSISIRPQKTLPFKDVLASLPDVLSEVELLQDFPFGRENGRGEAFGVNVNPENVPPLGHDNIRLGQVCDNLQVWSQPEGLASPTTPHQTTEPIPIPVLPDGHCDSPSRIESELNEMERPGLERLAVPRDVELDGNAVDLGATLLLPPDSYSEVADHLDIESSKPLGLRSNTTPEVVELLVVAPFGKKSVGLSSSSLSKRRKNILFGGGGISLKKDSSLHSPNRRSVMARDYLSRQARLLPPLVRVGFLGVFR